MKITKKEKIKNGRNFKIKRKKYEKNKRNR